MNEDLNTQISQMLADVKVVVDNQNKILATVPNAEVLKNELASKTNNDDFKPVLDAMNLHLNNANFSENGYTRLPNGLVFQWMKIGASGTYTLPITTTKLLSIVATPFLSGPNIGTTDAKKITESQIQVRHNSNECFVFCLGY